MFKSTAALPDWELVLSSAARLQRILPDAVLVGGAASAIHAGHRFSRDADPVLTDLRYRFDALLAELESVRAGKRLAFNVRCRFLAVWTASKPGCGS